MEQTAYHEQPLSAQTEAPLEDAHGHDHDHTHSADESEYDPRDYMATKFAWTAFFIGSTALVLAGIVGGLLALWFYNYTTNGFS